MLRRIMGQNTRAFSSVLFRRVIASIGIRCATNSRTDQSQTLKPSPIFIVHVNYP